MVNRDVKSDCRRTKYLLINTVLLLILIIYVTSYTEKHSDVESDPEIYYWRSDLLNNNISCVYDNKADALPSADDGFSPPEHSIYFHETSCRNGLNTREACAIESAAKSHPNWHIHVLFSGPITAASLNTGSLAVLKQFHNVKLMRIHLNFTKAYRPLADKIIQQSIYPSEELSHLLRFLTLRRWGGVYLDLDVVVVRSFESLPKNWVARENDNSIGSAITAIFRDDVGRNFSEEILRETNASFAPSDWSYKGSNAITKVFRNKCSPRRPAYWTASVCQGFSVFEPTLFYPLFNSQSKDYLRAGHIKVGSVYTHHMWNQKTKGEVVHKNSPYLKLARRYCPKIFNKFGEKFAADGV